METSRAGELVAANVRRVREMREMRQLDVARRLGWSKATLSKLEGGTRRITVEDLLALSVVLDVAPAYLLAPWEESDGELVVNLGVEAVIMDSSAAVAWIIGEHAIGDPRNYYWTVPQSQQGRRAEILRRLEAAGIVSFPDADTVVFRGGMTRSTKPEED